MKNLNISISVIVLAFFSLLFTSCDKEEFEITSQPDIVKTDPDTITITDELVFRLDGEENRSYNGIGVSCLDPSINAGKYLNFIAYGEDLRIEDDQAYFEKEVFTIY